MSKGTLLTKSPQVNEQPASEEEISKKRKRSAGSDLEGATNARPSAPVPDPADSNILPSAKVEAPSVPSGLEEVTSILSARQLLGPAGVTITPSANLPVTLEDNSVQAGPAKVGL